MRYSALHLVLPQGGGMRYHWLAHHLVQEQFPKLNKNIREQIISEAVCRAWCTFLSLDCRLMQSCILAAAQRGGLVPPQEVRSPAPHPQKKPTPRNESPRRAAVIRLSDYR